jgi:hypothetical protein
MLAAHRLRIDDPELYGQILSQADGSVVQDTAARDPDAYVALFPAGAAGEGMTSGDIELTVESQETPQFQPWAVAFLDERWNSELAALGPNPSKRSKNQAHHRAVAELVK